MRTALLIFAASFALAACNTPSPEVRSQSWESDAYLLTEPAADY